MARSRDGCTAGCSASCPWVCPSTSRLDRRACSRRRCSTSSPSPTTSRGRPSRPPLRRDRHRQVRSARELHDRETTQALHRRQLVAPTESPIESEPFGVPKRRLHRCVAGRRASATQAAGRRHAARRRSATCCSSRRRAPVSYCRRARWSRSARRRRARSTYVRRRRVAQEPARDRGGDLPRRPYARPTVALEMPPARSDRREDLGEIIASVARSGAGGRSGPVRIGVASARAPSSTVGRAAMRELA